MKRFLILCLLCLPLVGRADNRWVPLMVAGHPIVAEVVHTEASRNRGLMYRNDLGEDRGMLFVFPAPGIQSMWMANTSIPLSVAFIAPDGVILNIRDMTPFSTDSHASTGMAGYALEVNQGWFRDRGIGPGERVEGLSQVPSGK